MGGSKKGERRGAAGGKRTGAHGRKPGRPHGSRNKPKFDAIKGLNTAARHKSRLELDEEREMFFMAVGKRDVLPIDILEQVMCYFKRSGDEYLTILMQAMERERAAIASGDKMAAADAAYAVRACENMVREYYVLATDVAHKAAPFRHARLQAIAVAPSTPGSNNPFDVIGMLMKEIDEAGRPPRFIEHDPNETHNSAK